MSRLHVFSCEHGFNRRSLIAALAGSALVSLAIQGAIVIAFG
jgi:hypothetical protein